MGVVSVPQLVPNNFVTRIKSYKTMKRMKSANPTAAQNRHQYNQSGENSVNQAYYYTNQEGAAAYSKSSQQQLRDLATKHGTTTALNSGVNMYPSMDNMSNSILMKGDL